MVDEKTCPGCGKPLHRTVLEVSALQVATVSGGEIASYGSCDIGETLRVFCGECAEDVSDLFPDDIFTHTPPPTNGEGRDYKPKELTIALILAVAVFFVGVATVYQEYRLWKHTEALLVAKERAEAKERAFGLLIDRIQKREVKHAGKKTTE